MYWKLTECVVGRVKSKVLSVDIDVSSVFSSE